MDDKKGTNLAKILEIEHQTTLATIYELLILDIINISNYKSNLKKYAESSWISADIVQKSIEEGEKYGR